MNKEDVKRIFELIKDEYLSGYKGNNHPVAFLLGGQGSVGKGQLSRVIVNQNSDLQKIFFINGDVYRNEHPDNKRLQHSPETYSSETQIFSSVFTEGFIKESIKRRLNVSVEGTMRNPNTPLTTASLFKKNGYKVEAYVIAAPAEFSSLNLYTRYANELIQGELGRLADKTSHDTAAEMMPMTVDTLYKNKAVDAINIYSCFAKDKVAEYHLVDGVWNYPELPSEIILKSRDKQKTDLSTMQRLLDRSKIIESVISNPNILNEVLTARDNLDKIIKEEKAVQTLVERTRNSWAKHFSSEQLSILSEYIESTTKESPKAKLELIWGKAKVRLDEQHTNIHWQNDTHKELLDLAEGKVRGLSNGWKL